MGKLTTLRKPNGGVRGIVAGDVVRRLVAHTMAQRSQRERKQLQRCSSGLSLTRADTECVTHVLQTLTDLDERATVVSVDGIDAYAMLSRCETQSSGKN